LNLSPIEDNIILNATKWHQQMEHLNGQTLQKLEQDKLVNGLDANFTNLSWGLFIFMYVGLRKHKHKGVFGTLFYLLMIYQDILKLVSL
jgi:hypothetical protein